MKKLLLILTLISPVALFYFATSDKAMIENSSQYNFLQLGQAQSLMRHLDTDQYREGETYFIEITSSDLQIASNLMWSNQTKFNPWFQQTDIKADVLEHKFSGQFEVLGFQRYLNLSVNLVPSQGLNIDTLAQIQSIKIGSITLPVFMNRLIEDKFWASIDQSIASQPAAQRFDFRALNPETKITQQQNLLLSFAWSNAAIGY
jgi:hypothetical protein